MKTKILSLTSLAVVIAVVTMLAFTFSPELGSEKLALNSNRLNACPPGLYVKVNGGIYPFLVTVTGVQGSSCSVGGPNERCCFSMEGQSAGYYTVTADNGHCKGGTSAYWPGGGDPDQLINVDVDAIDCY